MQTCPKCHQDVNLVRYTDTSLCTFARGVGSNVMQFVKFLTELRTNARAYCTGTSSDIGL